MDTDKIYKAAMNSLSKELTRDTKADAIIINEAIAKAIAAAFEEYNKQNSNL